MTKKPRRVAVGAALVCAAHLGCSAEAQGPIPSRTNARTTGSSSGAASSGSSGSVSDTPAPASACHLGDVSGARAVKPTFVIDSPPNVHESPQGGGALTGQHRIVEATIYLPAKLAGLVDLHASTGSVSGWAIFDGDAYSLSVGADLQIATVVGAQPQKIASQGQGTFREEGAAIEFASSCDADDSLPSGLAYTNAGDHVRLIVKDTSSGQGDVYVVLETERVK